MPPRFPNPRQRHSTDRGIALIAVLVLIAALTLLATGVASLGVSHRRSAQRFAQSVQADITADSAIRVLLLKLTAPADQAATPTVLRQRMDILGVAVDVTLEREAERIDLNFADEESLAAVFTANGWNEQQAQAMAARIQDWRDDDDVTRPDGAEKKEYAAAGFSYGPRNAPLESPEELRQIMGGERATDSMLEALTVYTHLTTPPVTAAAAGQAPNGSYIGEIVRIRACLPLEGYKRCRLVVARLTGGAYKPVQIFKWNSQINFSKNY